MLRRVLNALRIMETKGASSTLRFWKTCKTLTVDKNNDTLYDLMVFWTEERG